MSQSVDENVSAGLAEVLESLLLSCSSEQYAVADCLNTIASNGAESATDEYLAGCAAEIRDAAQQVIDYINRSEQTPASTEAERRQLYEKLKAEFEAQ